MPGAGCSCLSAAAPPSPPSFWEEMLLLTVLSSCLCGAGPQPETVLSCWQLPAMLSSFRGSLVRKDSSAPGGPGCWLCCDRKGASLAAAGVSLFVHQASQAPAAHMAFGDGLWQCKDTRPNSSSGRTNQN